MKPTIFINHGLEQGSFFNHPNFAFASTNADSTPVGLITQTVSQATTIHRSGLSADASPRLIELQAKFTV